MADVTTRSSVEQRLAEMAQQDPQFRSELKQNPKAALAKMFGGDLPDNVNVLVHEEDPNTVHLVLPAADANANSTSAATTYCNGGSGHSWSSCGYELSCYGPTCC